MLLRALSLSTLVSMGQAHRVFVEHGGATSAAFGCAMFPDSASTGPKGQSDRS
jgi:hypothetical protein